MYSYSLEEMYGVTYLGVESHTTIWSYDTCCVLDCICLYIDFSSTKKKTKKMKVISDDEDQEEFGVANEYITDEVKDTGN